MTVQFIVVTDLSCSPERAFDLSLDIDEHVASMAHSGERAVAGVTSGQIGPGEEVTWRARHFGIPFTMTSRIVEFERPTRFVDEQVRGPFQRFHHEHRFEPTDTGTRMTDTITFDAPLGLLGDVVERIVLGRYLQRLITRRNTHLRITAREALDR